MNISHVSVIVRATAVTFTTLCTCEVLQLHVNTPRHKISNSVVNSIAETSVYNNYHINTWSSYHPCFAWGHLYENILSMSDYSIPSLKKTSWPNNLAAEQRFQIHGFTRHSYSNIMLVFDTALNK